MFQRQHYEAIAEVLDHLQLDGDVACNVLLVAQVARALSVMFAQDNPYFQQGKFLQACGL